MHIHSRACIRRESLAGEFRSALRGKTRIADRRKVFGRFAFLLPTGMRLSNPVRHDAAGMLRVGNTRVTLDTIVNAYEAGATVLDICLDYDAVTLSEISAAIDFYLHHKQVLEPYFTSRAQASTAALSDISIRQATSLIRNQLLTRKTIGG